MAKQIPQYIRDVTSKLGVNKFVLAVSGGSDSQCLLKKFPAALPESDCLAVGINHGFRSEADAELDLAERLATRVGVPFRRIKLDIEVPAGESKQAIARERRYNALFAAAAEFGTQYVVTAHHKLDLAETVLIKLLRGSHHIDELMPPVKQMGNFFIVRPMIKVHKKDIMRELNHFDIPYADDPSNDDEDYLRVWVRKTLIPLMKEKSPNIELTLANVGHKGIF